MACFKLVSVARHLVAQHDGNNFVLNENCGEGGP
jgi:hypothetical protein